MYHFYLNVSTNGLAEVGFGSGTKTKYHRTSKGGVQTCGKY